MLPPASCCLHLLRKREQRPEEAKALLAKAVAHVKSVGPDKAVADFMVKPGPWVDRDLYLSVYDMTGKTMAHVNPRMVGKDNMNLQDANGKFHVKERFEIVKMAKGKGQQEFAFLNPMTKQIEAKIMFFEKVGDLVVRLRRLQAHVSAA